MPVPVGITVPKLLPITGTFAPFFATYFVFLSGRVVVNRLRSRTVLGTKENSPDDRSRPDALTVAARCHANFAENVPLALLLGAVVELNGGDRRALTIGFASLFVFRVLHAELGLQVQGARGKGRVIGHGGTLTWIIGFAGYAAYLVKSFWGY